MTVQFVCYSPSAAAHLSILEETILDALDELRGFLRRDGVDSVYLQAQVRRRTGRDVSRHEVVGALRSLDRLGLASRVMQSLHIHHGGKLHVTRWKAACRA